MITVDQMTNINVPLLLTIYQWILDNGGKPHVQFKINEKCKLPAQYLTQPYIILNLSPGAVEDLMIDIKGVSFRARFNGLEHQMYFPFENIVGVTGGRDFDFGLLFPMIPLAFMGTEETKPPQPPQPQPEPPKPKRINHLTRVK